MGKRADSLKLMQSELRDIIRDVIVGSDQIIQGSLQLSQSAIQLAQSATQQPANGEEVSSSVDQMASLCRKSALPIQQLTEESMEKANRAGQTIQSIVTDINKTSHLISKINDASLEQLSDTVRFFKPGLMVSFPFFH